MQQVFQNIPQNSSVRTIFKQVKVFSRWFVIVRVTASDRPVVRNRIHEKSWADCYWCLSPSYFIYNVWKCYSYRLAAEIKLGISIEMVVKPVLAQKSKESAKQTA